MSRAEPRRFCHFVETQLQARSSAYQVTSGSALRNTSPATVTLLLTTTPNIYRFFRELGKPFHPDQPLGPPTPQDMQRLLDLAAKHNYWTASPQDNEAIGLSGF